MCADTLVSALQPIWFLTHFLGMSPFSLRRLMHNKKKSLFEKIYYCLYAFAVISIAIASVYYSIDVRINPQINVLVQLTQFLLNVTNILSMMSILIASLVYQNKLSIFLRRLHEFDLRMRSVLKWNPYTTPKLFINISTFTVLTVWVLWFFDHVVIGCIGKKLTCLKEWLIIQTSTKVSDLLALLFCAFVVILKHKLQMINDNIKYLIKQQRQGKSDLFSAQALGVIEKLYNEILIAGAELQSVYAIPLLLKVANLFVSIFSGLYLCMFGYISNGILVKLTTFSEVALPLLLIIIAVVELLTFVTVCELTKSEFKATGRLIYQIPMSKSCVMLMKRVNLFALHLLHADFDFSGYGLFKINGSLLQTIAGAVTVYLVMLIQFDMATNRNPKTLNPETKES